MLAIPDLIHTECHFFPQSKFIPRFVENIHHIENKKELNYVFSLFDNEIVICNKTPDLKLEWTYEMRNIIRNQEQVIEHLIFQSMNIKVEEDDEDLEIDVLYKPNII